MDNLQIKISVDGAGQAKAELLSVGNSLGQVNTSAGNAHGSVSKFGGALGLVGGAIAALGLAKLAKDFVVAADTVSGLNARLKLVTNSTKEYATAQAELEAIANRHNASYEAVVTLYSRAAQAANSYGFSQQQVLNSVEAVSAGLRLSGADAMEQASVLKQFSQALGSGVMRGEEFNAMMENGSAISAALAESLGVSIGQLRKMAEDGQLTTNVVVNALNSQLDNLKEKSASIPMTVGAAWQQLSNSLLLFSGSASEALSINSTLADGLMSVKDAVDAVRDAMPQIAESASYAAAEIGVVFNTLSRDLQTLEETTRDLRGFLIELSGFEVEGLEDLSAMQKIFLGIGYAIGVAAPMLGAFLTFVGTNFSNLGTAIKSIWNQTVDFISSGLDVISGAAGVAAGAFLNFFVNAFAGMVNATGEAFAFLGEKLKSLTSLGGIEVAGIQLFNGFEGVSLGLDGIGKSAIDAAEKIKTMANHGQESAEQLKIGLEGMSNAFTGDILKTLQDQRKIAGDQLGNDAIGISDEYFADRAAAIGATTAKLEANANALNTVGDAAGKTTPKLDGVGGAMSKAAKAAEEFFASTAASTANMLALASVYEQGAGAVAAMEEAQKAEATILKIGEQYRQQVITALAAESAARSQLEIAKSIAEYNQQNEAIKEQVAALIAGSAATAAYNAAKEAQSTLSGKNIGLLGQEANALRKVVAESQALAQIKDIVEKNRTSQQKYNDELSRLKDLYKQVATGAIDMGDSTNATLTAIQSEMDNLSGSGETMATLMEESLKRLDSAAAGMWEDMLKGGNVSLDSLKDMALKTLAEIIHAFTTKKIVANISGMINGTSGGGIGNLLSGLFGKGDAAAGSSGGGLMDNLSSLLSSGKDAITSAMGWLGGGISAGAAAVNSAITGIFGGSVGLGAGSMAAGASLATGGITGGVGAFGGAVGLGGAAGGAVGSAAGGAASAATGVTLSGVMGVALPVIGLLAGPLLGKLFQKKPSDKAAWGTVDISDSSTHDVGSMTGKKHSKENNDARDVVTAAIGDFAKFIRDDLGGELSGSMKVLIGSRDGLRLTGLDGVEQKFEDADAMIKFALDNMLNNAQGVSENIVALVNANKEELNTEGLVKYLTNLHAIETFAGTSFSTLWEEAKGESKTVWQSYKEQANAALELANEFDGSVESTEELAVALANMAGASIIAMAGIESIGEALAGAFATTRETIRQYGMTNEQKYDEIMERANDLTDQIKITIDPAEIQKMGDELNDLIKQGWDLTPDESKTGKQQEFLDYLDSVNELIQGRLDAAKAEIEDNHNTTGEVVDGKLDEAAAAAAAQAAAAALSGSAAGLSGSATALSGAAGALAGAAGAINSMVGNVTTVSSNAINAVAASAQSAISSAASAVSAAGRSAARAESSMG